MAKLTAEQKDATEWQAIQQQTTAAVFGQELTAGYCQHSPPQETVVLLTTSKIQTGDSFTMQIPNISH